MTDISQILARNVASTLSKGVGSVIGSGSWVPSFTGIEGLGGSLAGIGGTMLGSYLAQKLRPGDKDEQPWGSAIGGGIGSGIGAGLLAGSGFGPLGAGVGALIGALGGGTLFAGSPDTPYTHSNSYIRFTPDLNNLDLSFGNTGTMNGAPNTGNDLSNYLKYNIFNRAKEQNLTLNPAAVNLPIFWSGYNDGKLYFRPASDMEGAKPYNAQWSGGTPDQLANEAWNFMTGNKYLIPSSDAVSLNSVKSALQKNYSPYLPTYSDEMGSHGGEDNPTPWHMTYLDLPQGQNGIENLNNLVDKSTLNQTTNQTTNSSLPASNPFLKDLIGGSFNMAKGGKVGALSEIARHKGRHGDTELVHMSKKEVKALENIGGQRLPRNPNTGMPEAFELDGILGDIGSVFSDIDPNDASIWDALGGSGENNLDWMPADYGDFVANGGDLGQWFSDSGLNDSWYSNVAGNSEDLPYPPPPMPPPTDNAAPSVDDNLPYPPPQMPPPSDERDFFDRALGWAGNNWKALGIGGATLALMLAMNQKKKNQAVNQAATSAATNNQAAVNAAQNSFNQPLPAYQFARAPISPTVNWMKAGSTPGGLQFYDNPSGSYSRMSKGGLAALNEMVRPTTTGGRGTRSSMKKAMLAMVGPTQGGSNKVPGSDPGQSDTVPAMLSSGEYVFDAHTVSDIGDGNSEAGARKLDQFRDNIARSKGRGKRVPPKAKPLNKYAKTSGIRVGG